MNMGRRQLGSALHCFYSALLCSALLASSCLASSCAALLGSSPEVEGVSERSGGGRGRVKRKEWGDGRGEKTGLEEEVSRRRVWPSLQRPKLPRQGMRKKA